MHGHLLLGQSRIFWTQLSVTRCLCSSEWIGDSGVLLFKIKKADINSSGTSI